MLNLVLTEVIGQKINLIRGHKVMMDKDLAILYGVKAIVLRQHVKRNRERFPEDFMFRLTKVEAQIMVSQNVIPSKRALGGYLPYAFTEQGVAMLSGILRSKKAIQINIAIMRAFVKLRKILSTNKALARKLEQLEQKTEKHDTEIQAIFEAIRQLMKPPEQPKRRVGFHRE